MKSVEANAFEPAAIDLLQIALNPATGLHPPRPRVRPRSSIEAKAGAWAADPCADPSTGDLSVRDRAVAFDPMSFHAKFGGVSLLRYQIGQVVYEQGTVGDSVFCIQLGKVKLTAVCANGKEAVIAILGSGEFCGSGCLSGQLQRISDATAVTECVIARLKKDSVRRAIDEDSSFSWLFISHLLDRDARLNEDLADQMCNSSEKRLARLLLLMAEHGKRGWGKPLSPRVNQQTLSDMVGTTRSRVNFFLNRFRQSGYIDYDDDIRVHASLKSVTR